MAVTERRISPRFKLNLPVRFRNRTEEIDAESYSVSRHGVFVLTHHLREPGELMQLHMNLPTEASGPDGKAEVPVKMMAVVAWKLTQAEAAQRGRKPGIGFKFYMMHAKDKALWDAFIDRLELDGPALPENMVKELNESDELFAPPVRYLLRARGVDMLQKFGGAEVRVGSMFLKTPMLRKPGERVDLVLIHPNTEKEFILPTAVRKVVSEGPVLNRGIELQFLEASGSLSPRFDIFLKTGAESQCGPEFMGVF